MLLAKPVRVKAAVLLGAAALGFTACGSNKSDTVSPTTALTGPAAANRQVLELGFLGALTGPDAQLGTNIRAGEQLAISHYNVDNPAVRVEIDSFDTEGEPARAAEGATKLAEDKVVAVIGPDFSAESEVAVPIFEAAGIPNVSVSASGDQLAENGWTSFHRVIANDAVQGSGDADYLVKTLGRKAVAVIDDSSTYGEALAVAVRSALPSSGGVDVLDDHIAGTGTDYTVTVERVLAVKANAVFFGGSSLAADRLATELRSLGYQGVFMASAEAGDARFVVDPGAAVAAGSYLSCPCADETGSSAAEVFVSAYRAAYGSAPGPYVAEAYDATEFLLAAIKSGAIVPEAIDAYLATSSYVGMTKTIKFRADGDLAVAPVYIYQVKDGRIVQVATAS